MKTTAAISGALVAALAAGALAIPTVSAAQPYGYASDCRSDGAAGTIIGGIAGAVLGSNLAAHHGGRAGGAAIGGVAGALLGNSIARSSGCQTYSQGYGYESRGYDSGYVASYPSYDYATTYSQPYYGGGYVVRDRDDRYRGHDWNRDRGYDRDHDRR